MNYTIKYSCKVMAIALICISQAGCKKLLNVEPPATSLTTETAFNDDYAATSVMTGLYVSLAQGNGSVDLQSIPRLAALSADEMSLWPGFPSDLTDYIAYYKNQLYPKKYTDVLPDFWPYPRLYTCNAIIENVSVATGLSSSVKNQLLGEARFVRAVLFFYLINFYGDIPMPLSTDIKINALLSRTSKDLVYQQIISDLKAAEGLLGTEYLNGGLNPYGSAAERVRPTRWAALALLARVYLYTQDYSNAEISASALINNNNLFGLTALNDVFKANSRETIWQLQTVASDRNTNDGHFFIQISSGPSPARPVYLSETMLNAFETGDARKTNGNWVNSVTTSSGATYYFPFKYKLRIGSAPKQEYIMMFRLGEQYLIRAEARARLGNVNGARDDLFAIRRRAGLADGTLTANSQASLMTAVMHERQVELFTEWGHRWFDLKRTGMVDAVMSVECPKKGGTWQSTDALYPLPYDDLQRDKNLTQNPGY